MLGIILGECLHESISTTWCSSTLYNGIAILSVQKFYLAIPIRFKTLCLIRLHKCLKIGNLVFINFYSASCRCLFALSSSSLNVKSCDK